MSEHRPALLDELDRASVGVAPIEHLLAGGRAAKRRRRRARMAGAAAATALVLGGGITAGLALTGQSDPSPEVISDGGKADTPSELPVALAWDEVGSALPSPELAPGWELVSLDGFGTHDGQYVMTNDSGASATVAWRPAAEHAARLEELSATSQPEAATLYAHRAKLFAHGEDDFTLLFKIPRGGRAFMEISGTGLGRAEFETFHRALSPSTVAQFTRVAAKDGVTVPSVRDSD